MNHKTSGIILTAAKAHETICSVFGNFPSGLTPINGKPIIFFILQQFLDNGIKDIYIGVDYQQEKIKEIISFSFGNRLNINYIFTSQNNSIGNSLLTILQQVQSKKVVIILGNTFVKEMELNKLNDNIVVSNDFIDESIYGTVEVDDHQNIHKYIDKKINSSSNFAIIGIYSFSDIAIFKTFNDSPTCTIVDLLIFYSKNKNKITAKKTKKWLDFSKIDKYYFSKKRLISSRSFNTLEYDDILGTITKKSTNKDKFKMEIKWQLDLPKDLKILAPRIVDYSLSNNSFITMEFYSYPTLSEIWLFSDLHDKIYMVIIDKLFSLLELFNNHKRKVNFSSYKYMYVTKTMQRISLVKNELIIRLLSFDKIKINNKEFNNWNTLSSLLFQKVELLYNENDNCLIHGDFCLSNILFDLKSGIAKLIDPRGTWGDSDSGDIKYDIAKLRHSVIGKYDYIVNDLFHVEINGNNNIYYDICNPNNEIVERYFDNKVSENYNIQDIKLIEGFLFFSMIPLHSDNPNRQIVMYAKAIQLFNEVL